MWGRRALASSALPQIAAGASTEGERWVVEPERSREVVGETRFVLHPVSSQRVTPEPLAGSVTDPPLSPTCSMWKV